MKAQWLKHTYAPELLIVFGGWALGPSPFLPLTGPQDVLFFDDYRQLDAPPPASSDYDTTTLLAFSFGVASSLHWMAQTGFSPDRLIAVNGTPCPADPDKGIAPDMIRATADGLSAANFASFCRRAGVKAPSPIDSPMHWPNHRDELFAIAHRGSAEPQRFDKIWISTRDRIIPTAAQRRAWADQAERTTEINAPHMPFAAGQSWKDWIT